MMYKIRLEVDDECDDGIRCYVGEVELPFVPAPGTEMQMCDCCNSETVKRIVYNHVARTITAYMLVDRVGQRTLDGRILIAYWHDRYTKCWGLTLDKSLSDLNPDFTPD